MVESSQLLITVLKPETVFLRFLLTTGWSNFVDQKKIVAWNSIVLLRAANGGVVTGKAKEIGYGSGLSSDWSLVATFGGGHSGFLCKNRNKLVNKRGGEELMGKLAAVSSVDAMTYAVNGRPFKVVYHQKSSTPEYGVEASTVKVAI